MLIGKNWLHEHGSGGCRLHRPISILEPVSWTSPSMWLDILTCNTLFFYYYYGGPISREEANKTLLTTGYEKRVPAYHRMVAGNKPVPPRMVHARGQDHYEEWNGGGWELSVVYCCWGLLRLSVGEVFLHLFYKLYTNNIPYIYCITIQSCILPS